MLQVLGAKDSTAQVNPRKLTEALIARAETLAGTRVTTGTVQGIETEPTSSGDKVVTGVVVDGETVKADAVVVAMGPWSGRAGAWLGVQLDVSGQKYHSAVLRTDAEVRIRASVFVGPRSQISGIHAICQLMPTPWLCNPSIDRALAYVDNSRYAGSLIKRLSRALARVRAGDGGSAVHTCEGDGGERAPRARNLPPPPRRGALPS